MHSYSIFCIFYFFVVFIILNSGILNVYCLLLEGLLIHFMRPYTNYYCGCRHVWHGVAIFLCLWQVKRAWTKNACIKVKNIEVRAKCLKIMGNLMYDTDVPDGQEMIA